MRIAPKLTSAEIDGLAATAAPNSDSWRIAKELRRC
jgi:hypothetical protein